MDISLKATNQLAGTIVVTKKKMKSPCTIDLNRLFCQMGKLNLSVKSPCQESPFFLSNFELFSIDTTTSLPAGPWISVKSLDLP